mgnify:FL=1
MTTETTTERPRTKVSTIVDRLFTQLEGTRTSFDSYIKDVPTPTEGTILVRWQRDGRETLRDIEETPAITVTKEDLDGFVFEQESKIENNTESIRLYHWGRAVVKDSRKRHWRSRVKIYLDRAYKTNYGRHSWSSMYATEQFELPNDSHIHRIVVEVDDRGGKIVKRVFVFKDESQLKNAITKAVSYAFKNSKVFAPSPKDSKKKYEERSITEQWAEDILGHRAVRKRKETITLEEQRMGVFAEELTKTGFIARRYDSSYSEKPLKVTGGDDYKEIDGEMKTELGIISIKLKVDSDGEWRGQLNINGKWNNSTPRKMELDKVQVLVNMAVDMVYPHSEAVEVKV